MRATSRCTRLLAMIVVASTWALAAAEDGLRNQALCGPGPPWEMYPVRVTKVADGGALLYWWAQGGFYNDIVRGSLNTLLATGGDFGAALHGCILDDQYDPDDASFIDFAVPEVGDGYWYLIRADQYDPSCWNGEGSYNSWQGYQRGDRNFEIQTSGRDCTCFALFPDPGYCQVYEVP